MLRQYIANTQDCELCLFFVVDFFVNICSLTLNCIQNSFKNICTKICLADQLEIKRASNKTLCFRRLVVYLYDICLALKETHYSFYCKFARTKSASFIACFQTIQYKKRSERNPHTSTDTGKKVRFSCSFSVKKDFSTVFNL